MRASLLFVIATIVMVAVPIAGAQVYNTKGCSYWCEWVGFQCCVAGMGLGNHVERYDAKAGGQCWAKCGVPPKASAVATAALPDFTITRADVQGQNGQWNIGALVENQGEGSYVNTKDSNLKLQVAQAIQRYPPRTGDPEKSTNSWYRLKSSGPFNAGDKKWTWEMNLRTFNLVPGTKYVYTAKVNPNGGVKETRLDNNILEAIVSVNKEGVLTVEKQ